MVFYPFEPRPVKLCVQLIPILSHHPVEFSFTTPSGIILKDTKGASYVLFSGILDAFVRHTQAEDIEQRIAKGRRVIEEFAANPTGILWPHQVEHARAYLSDLENDRAHTYEVPDTPSRGRAIEEVQWEAVDRLWGELKSIIFTPAGQKKAGLAEERYRLAVEREALEPLSTLKMSDLPDIYFHPYLSERYLDGYEIFKSSDKTVREGLELLNAKEVEALLSSMQVSLYTPSPASLAILMLLARRFDLPVEAINTEMKYKRLINSIIGKANDRGDNNGKSSSETNIGPVDGFVRHTAEGAIRQTISNIFGPDAISKFTFAKELGRNCTISVVPREEALGLLSDPAARERVQKSIIGLLDSPLREYAAINIKENLITVSIQVNARTITPLWSGLAKAEIKRGADGLPAPYSNEEIADILAHEADAIMAANPAVPAYDQPLFTQFYGYREAVARGAYKGRDKYLDEPVEIGWSDSIGYLEIQRRETPGLRELLLDPEARRLGRYLRYENSEDYGAQPYRYYVDDHPDMNKIAPAMSYKLESYAGRRSEHTVSYHTLFDAADAVPYFAYYLRRYGKEKNISKYVFLARGAGTVYESSVFQNALSRDEFPATLFFNSIDLIGEDEHRCLHKAIVAFTRIYGEPEYDWLVKETGRPGEATFERLIQDITGEKRMGSTQDGALNGLYRTDEHWRAIIDSVYERIRASMLLDGVKAGGHICIVDEYGTGSMGFIMKYIVEKKTAAEGKPVIVDLFFGSSTGKSESGRLPDGFPMVYPKNIEEDFGLSEEDASRICRNMSYESTWLPQPFFIIKPEGKILPILETEIPISFEDPSIYILSRLRSLLVYNATVKFFRQHEAKFAAETARPVRGASAALALTGVLAAISALVILGLPCLRPLAQSGPAAFMRDWLYFASGALPQIAKMLTLGSLGVVGMVRSLSPVPQHPNNIVILVNDLGGNGDIASAWILAKEINRAWPTAHVTVAMDTTGYSKFKGIVPGFDKNEFETIIGNIKVIDRYKGRDKKDVYGDRKECVMRNVDVCFVFESNDSTEARWAIKAKRCYFVMPYDKRPVSPDEQLGEDSFFGSDSQITLDPFFSKEDYDGILYFGFYRGSMGLIFNKELDLLRERYERLNVKEKIARKEELSRKICEMKGVKAKPSELKTLARAMWGMSYTYELECSLRYASIIRKACKQNQRFNRAKKVVFVFNASDNEMSDSEMSIEETAKRFRMRGFSYSDIKNLSASALATNKGSVVINLESLPMDMYNELSSLCDMPVQVTGAVSLTTAMQLNKVWLYERLAWFIDLEDEINAIAKKCLDEKEYIIFRRLLREIMALHEHGDNQSSRANLPALFYDSRIKDIYTKLNSYILAHKKSLPKILKVVANDWGRRRGRGVSKTKIKSGSRQSRRAFAALEIPTVLTIAGLVAALAAAIAIGVSLVGPSAFMRDWLYFASGALPQIAKMLTAAFALTALIYGIGKVSRNSDSRANVSIFQRIIPTVLIALVLGGVFGVSGCHQSKERIYIQEQVELLKGNKGQYAHRDAAAALDKLNWEPQTKEEKIAYAIAKWDVKKIASALAEMDEDALVKIGRPAVHAFIEDLKQDLKSGNTSSRDPALEILENIAEYIQDVSILTELLKDNGDDCYYLYNMVRSRAAEALGNIDGKQAVPALIEALKDKEADVRKSAAGALGNKHWKPQTEEEKITYAIAQEDWDAIVKIGKPAVTVLIKVLKEGRGLRYAVIDALGNIGDKEAV